MNDVALEVPPQDARRRDAAGADPNHPWLGLASFTEATRAYFRGRDEEVAELARRVQRKLLTILFGQSGLGKTSILRAGLVPRLRETHCPVYVRIDYAPESPPPAEQIKQAIFKATQTSGQWTQEGVAVAGESLWEFLHHRDDVLRDASGRTLIPLLIFDQFEEIFTIAQGDEAGRARAAQFVEDLADLVENRAPKAIEAKLESDDSAIERFDFARADYRILIALREDYLAHLEGLKSLMPSITQNRMRLARMTGAQALDAVTIPGGRLVSEEVAEAIVRFIAGGAELRNAEVEPALLSLICSELNNVRLRERKDEISADVLAGSRDTILAEFYERALADQPPGVRQVIEDHLLTESGYRESLAEERLVKLLAGAGAPAGALGTLVDRRLLRVEERLDVRRVELTHDVLCGVVKSSRDLRLEREARDAAEHKLAAQRARERATRQALVRARKIAAGCAVLAVVAIASAIYGYVSTRRAEVAEAKADDTRLMAEAARGEAEKLVVYLLDDFQQELAPVGRLDIVAGLAKRALDYYNGLPESLRTPQTERNRALALVRYGSVLRTQARIEEGRKAIEEAIAVLERMREQGDTTEPTTIGLALALSTRARLSSSVEADDKALAHSQRAVDAIEPLASAPNASVAARRAHGDVLNMHGFLLMRNDRNEAAVAALQKARDAYRSIDEGKFVDLSAAAGFAEASAWIVESSKNLGRGDEARRAANDAIETASRILEQRPGHLQALRAQALAASPFSVYLWGNMQLAEALKYNEAAERGWREYVRYDPGNAISWGNLGVAYWVKSFILQGMGRIDEAAAANRAVFEFKRDRVVPNMTQQLGLANHAGRLALLERVRGNVQGSDAALALNAKHNAWAIERLPPGYLRDLRMLQGDWWRFWALTDSGDFRGAYEIGKVLHPKIELLKPGPAEQREYAFDGGFAYMALAQAANAIDEYAAAERAASRGLELRGRYPQVDANDTRIIANLRAMRGLALARMDRIAEAREDAAAALKQYRELAAGAYDDRSLPLDLALALYAAAVSGVAEPRAALGEALAQFDKLPRELRGQRYATVWRDRIAAERAARR